MKVRFWHDLSQLSCKRKDLIVAFFVIRITLDPPLQCELEMVS